MNEKIKIALLVDNRAISKWQADALEGISDLVDVRMILSCNNTVNERRPLHYAAYYLLNLISIKGALTRRRRTSFNGCPVIDFDSRYESTWQWIPDEVVGAAARSGCVLIIKFGMALLKTDNLSTLDVFSFHHGDPRFYRGRPAGFYELLDDAHSVGVIVQKLSNVLDGGRVYGLGFAKAYSYSYRKTLQDLYRNSSAVLRRAVLNYLSNTPLEIQPDGKNYRLPSNAVVVLFSARMLAKKLKRIFYGAFFEKRWNVLVVKEIQPVGDLTLTVSNAQAAKLPRKYNFYADPFFSADASIIRVEALVASTGLGEIVELRSETLNVERILLSGAHFSYPYTFEENGREFVLPEVAAQEAPYLLEVSQSPEKIPLVGLERLRLVDPSLVKAAGRYYLFGGHPGSAGDMLHLYVADFLAGPYVPHGQNPIVIDPTCARMGGRFFTHEGNLLRFGQDNSSSYGNGIRIMKIVQMDSENYQEQHYGQIRFFDANGPHTVDIRNGRAVVDFYIDRFSLFAGYRRVAAKIHHGLRVKRVTRE